MMLLGSLFTRFYHTLSSWTGLFREPPLFMGSRVLRGGCFKQPLSLPNYNLGHLARARHEIAAAPGGPLISGPFFSDGFLVRARHFWPQLPEPTAGSVYFVFTHCVDGALRRGGPP